MKELLTGNEAVSRAVTFADVNVISAYPITPQTSIVEKLSGFCSDGTLNAEFIAAESEHSALACLIGASTAGARVFTATSSQGLALMHELLHWSSGARLPIVIVNVNRAMAAPWTIWCDHQDSLSQRDTGVIQFYCENCQETFDTVLQAYRIAEIQYLPCMINIDGFFLSHTSEPVEIPTKKSVKAFLPAIKNAYAIDVDNPRSYSSGTTPEFFYEFKAKIHNAFSKTEEIHEQINSEFYRIFGRSYGSLDTFMIDDAEIVLISMGTLCGTARTVVRELREKGKKIGLIRLRLFRPFPAKSLCKLLNRDIKVGVIDRNFSYGKGGIVYSELNSSLYNSTGKNSKNTPRTFSFIAGLGGRDVTQEDIRAIVHIMESEKTPEKEQYWIGLKNEFV